uniref:Uncharacterized protein n=1 Tax=Picea glauca TaxID=3330 RepID=A0A117NIP1_PICGL|nr:hypothetical protein ABT39_MTgene68 [Picea glauca]QHR90765.1 hypothetical protein Q903MT_gene4791 [Picea sitchensis]
MMSPYIKYNIRYYALAHSLTHSIPFAASLLRLPGSLGTNELGGEPDQQKETDWKSDH